MRPRESATLAVKVLALFVLSGLPNGIVGLAENWHTLKAITEGIEIQKSPLIFAVLQVSLTLLVSATLWFKAEQVASKIFPISENTGDAEEATSNHDWVRVLLGLMGIWLILSSFPRLVANTFHFVAFGNTFSEDQHRLFLSRGILTDLLQLVVGCLMLLWRKLIDFFRALLFFQLRDSGSPMRITVSSTHCPYCKEEIEGQERWVCRQCGSQHHQASGSKMMVALFSDALRNGFVV